MKRIASISLTTLFVIQALAPNMDLCCELEKLPELFAHYEEHKSLDNDSFLEFLAEDYVSHQGDHEGHHDDSNHDDLPFHGQHQCNHAPTLLTISYNNIHFNLPYFLMVNNGSQYLFPSSSEYLDEMIQPPQS